MIDKIDIKVNSDEVEDSFLDAIQKIIDKINEIIDELNKDG